MRLLALSRAALLAYAFLVSSRSLSTRQLLATSSEPAPALPLPDFLAPGPSPALGTSPLSPFAVASTSPNSNLNFDFLTSPDPQISWGASIDGSPNLLGPGTSFTTAYSQVPDPQQPDTFNAENDPLDVLIHGSDKVDPENDPQTDTTTSPSLPVELPSCLAALKLGGSNSGQTYCIFSLSGTDLVFKRCSQNPGGLKAGMEKWGIGITLYRISYKGSLIVFAISNTLYACQVRKKYGNHWVWTVESKPNCSEEAFVQKLERFEAPLNKAFNGVFGDQDEFQWISYQELGAKGDQYDISDFTEGRILKIKMAPSIPEVQ